MSGKKKFVAIQLLSSDFLKYVHQAFVVNYYQKCFSKDSKIREIREYVQRFVAKNHSSVLRSFSKRLQRLKYLSIWWVSRWYTLYISIDKISTSKFDQKKNLIQDVKDIYQDAPNKEYTHKVRGSIETS